jgi:hypothetical protein
MQVVNFLAEAVVDNHPKMVRYLKPVGHQLDSAVEHGQNLRRGGVEIFRFDFWNQKQMNGSLGAMVGDNDNFVILVEYLRGQFPVDYAREYRWHGLKLANDEARANHLFGDTRSPVHLPNAMTFIKF